jgi:hypothetical protein
MHLDKEQLFFYHKLPLEQVERKLLIPNPAFSDSEFLPAYRWLEQEIGFFPLFLAVGREEAAYVTGYQNQWLVNLGGRQVDGVYQPIIRKAGDFPNYVLFAFPIKTLEGVYTDYLWWNIVLSDVLSQVQVSSQLRRLLFKKSWPTHKWLRLANQDGHQVQFLAAQLDLAQASFVWVRNEKTAKTLRNMGFHDVRVKRLSLSD